MSHLLTRTMLLLWLLAAGVTTAAVLAGQAGQMPPVLEYAQYETSGVYEPRYGQFEV